jgi:hypothetical protein
LGVRVASFNRPTCELARELLHSMSSTAQYPLVIRNGLADQALNSQYPAFHLSYDALGPASMRASGRPRGRGRDRHAKPGSNAEGVMLVTCTVLRCKAAAPYPRIDLRNSGASFRKVPAVERPEMYALPSRCRMKRSQGIPAWLDFPTCVTGPMAHGGTSARRNRSKLAW